MNKLKIAIGIDGKGVFLERFPDDEEHAGLQDMFDWLKDDLYEFEESPGIYLATISMESPGPRYDDPYPDPYLVVDKLEKVDGPEVLSNDLVKANQDAGKSGNVIACVKQDELEQANAKIKELEAKLEIAVEALENLTIPCTRSDYKLGDLDAAVIKISHEALEKLRGEKW